MQKIIPNKDAMLQHLKFLFSDIGDYKDGKIEISYTAFNSSAVTMSSYFDVSELSAAVEFSYKKNKEEGVNVYVGATLRDPNTAPFGRSSVRDFYAATALWVDLDDADAAKTAKEKYNNLPPSMIVVTGQHPNLRAQCWWHLMHPETDQGLIKDNLSFICSSLSGDSAVVDIPRVMRLGGSIAWPKKDGRIPELTEIVIPENNTKMVMIDRFKSYFPNAAPTLLTATKAPALGEVGRNVITQKINISALLEETRKEGHWHVSMRDAIAAMVARGWSDEQIRIAANPYRRDRSLVDDTISPLIGSARKKWDIPEPETGAKPEHYDAETGEIKKTFPLVYADDISPSLEANDFVEGLLCENQFSVIYGASNCGKTFFMLDLAIHVALGKPWRGKHVEQGGVIYAALEGGQGTKNRIVAFKKHHSLVQKIPLAIIPSSINFLSPDNADVEALLNSIQGAQDRLGKVKLIVIDTLARAISGGDENSSMDMGKMIIQADIIRAQTGAHISFIHHSGKDDLKGARGHSSLRAAVDTEIEISRADERSNSSIRIVKQREMEMIEPMSFSLERIVLGENKRGVEITSCVVLPEEYKEGAKTKKLTPTQDFIYSCIVDALLACGVYRSPHRDMPQVKCITYEDLHDALERRGYKEFLETEKKTTATQVKNATTNARISLQKMSKISFYGNYIWVLGDGE